MVGVVKNCKTNPPRKSKGVSHADMKSAGPFPKFSDEVISELVESFKLFADETRFRILHYLTQHRELNVRTLCDMLSQSQPAVSHHLALLRVASLIESRRDGKHNFYRLLPLRLQELTAMLCSVSPNTAGRLGFETFALSFTPVKNSSVKNSS